MSSVLKNADKLNLSLCLSSYCIVDLKKLTMWLLSRVNSLMPAIIIMVSLDELSAGRVDLSL